ncbi:hypothetical protein [Cellulosimicrobium sp. NPDC057862]|uniref:hypothetical protein n=1 Tax=Cellulosimicrobium sp. NPDC057862 TaxID=3346266 RepID=UPI00366C449D
MSALRTAWTSMAAELDGDTEAVRRFYATYLSLVGPRVEAVARAVDRGDDRGARTALLALRCTSVMAGAEDLAAAADRMLALPVAAPPQVASRALRALGDAASGTRTRVSGLLASPPATRAAQAGGSNR